MYQSRAQGQDGRLECVNFLSTSQKLLKLSLERVARISCMEELGSQLLQPLLRLAELLCCGLQLHLLARQLLDLMSLTYRCQHQ